MSTHGNIIIKDGNDLILTIGKHWDGYPSELGKKILACLEGAEIVGDAAPYGNKFVCYGMGCLAATLLAALKTEQGDVYIGGMGLPSYVYTITPHKVIKWQEPALAHIHIVKGSKVIYNGLLNDLTPALLDAMD